jgi:hypothetical protein
MLMEMRDKPLKSVTVLRQTASLGMTMMRIARAANKGLVANPAPAAATAAICATDPTSTIVGTASTSRVITPLLVVMLHKNSNDTARLRVSTGA